MPGATAVRYTTTRSGVQIAFEVLGDGPLDIVWVNGFASNLDLNAESPFFEHYQALMPRFARVLSFDKRGSGLSERSLGAGTLEDRMDDVRAAMDAAGLERAAVAASADGGPIALAFAATYPERVTGLVFQSAWARLGRAPGYEVGVPPEVFEQFLEFVEQEWGTGAVLSVLGEGVVTEAHRELVARIERSQGPPHVIAEQFRLDYQMDARDALPLIAAPTLVLEYERGALFGAELGRYVADGIPGSRYQTIRSAWGGKEGISAISEFLTGIPADATFDVERVLATVLFTDVVGSTAQATRLGDAAWRALLDRHDRVIRTELARYSGKEVDTAGDGFFATFDGPARAVRCAKAICEATHSLGLEVRAGVHTGEVTRRTQGYAGMAVHIGARVAGMAGPSEVLTSSTVRDLVIGSGIEFEDRGTHQLKGVEGKWNLLAVR